MVVVGVAGSGSFEEFFIVIDAIIVGIASAVVGEDRREAGQFPRVRQAVTIGIVGGGVLAVQVKDKILRQRGGVGDQEKVAVTRQPGPGHAVKLLVESAVGDTAGVPMILRSFRNRSLFEVKPDCVGMNRGADPAAGIGGYVDAVFQDAVWRNDVGDIARVEWNRV